MSHAQPAAVKKHPWRWVAVAVAAVVGTCLVILLMALPFSSDTLRHRAVRALSEQLDSEVELDTLSLTSLPRLHAEGGGLRIRHRGRRDVPPLISVRAFTVD